MIKKLLQNLIMLRLFSIIFISLVLKTSAVSKIKGSACHIFDLPVRTIHFLVIILRYTVSKLLRM